MTRIPPIIPGIVNSEIAYARKFGIIDDALVEKKIAKPNSIVEKIIFRIYPNPLITY